VNKREIVLSIIIVAGFVLVMLCMVKTSDIGRRLSALEIEQQRPCNVSVSVTCVPTPSLKGNKMNLAGDYNMLGELYVEMDSFLEAEAYFMRAATVSKEISLRPELAGAWQNLGLLYKKKGLKSKAWESSTGQAILGGQRGACDQPG